MVQAKTHPISWDPDRIGQTLALGLTKGLKVTFISGERMKDVDLRIVPELQPYISVTPNHFATIDPDTPYEVNVNITVPEDNQSGLYQGTIHLRSISKTYPQTLKVELNIVDLMEGAVWPSDTPIETTTMTYETDAGPIEIEAVKGRVIVLFNLLKSCIF
jgi:hypothetical protein